jgi:hypothetical protein
MDAWLGCLLHRVDPHGTNEKAPAEPALYRSFVILFRLKSDEEVVDRLEDRDQRIELMGLVGRFDARRRL